MDFGTTLSRERPVGVVFASPTVESKQMESEYERSAYVQMEEPVRTDFTVGNIIKYLAGQTTSMINEYVYKLAGHYRYLVIFPTRNVRDMFVVDETKARIDGVVVNFKAWKVSANTIPFVLKQKVYGLPEHHYSFGRAANPVTSFGRLAEIDEGKIRTGISSLDILIDTQHVDMIPQLVDYYFDYFYMRKVRISVELEMDYPQYLELDVDKGNFMYEEVYQKAFDA